MNDFNYENVSFVRSLQRKGPKQKEKKKKKREKKKERLNLAEGDG